MKVKDLSRAQLKLLAELAFASHVEDIYTIWDEQEQVMLVFVDRRSLLNDDAVRKYGISHVKSKFHDFMEIDGSFNVQINFNNMCNVALIYKLIFSWGFKPSMEGTGLFPKSKFVPETLKQLQTTKSEKL